MGQEPVKFDSSLVTTLARGAEKTFENAEQLYNEGLILAKAGAIARALFLHQISLEECSKVQTLGAWAISLLSGKGIDRSKTLRALTRHSAKNKLNAYMLKGSAAEEDARKRGDIKTALSEFEKLQDEFHRKSNTAKNASLYVDWGDASFIAPIERITNDMLADIVERNAEFLSYAHSQLRLFAKLEEEPNQMLADITSFMEALNKLVEEKSDDVEGVLSAFLRK